MISINFSNKSFAKTYILYFIFIIQFSCTQAPIRIQHFDYNLERSVVLLDCRNILNELEYEIDIFSPESFALSTKSIRIRNALRRYDYVLFFKISDYIEIHLAAKKNIFNRGSESNLGSGGFILKQPESFMPLSLQKKIYQPLYKELNKKGYKTIHLK